VGECIFPLETKKYSRGSRSDRSCESDVINLSFVSGSGFRHEGMGEVKVIVVVIIVMLLRLTGG